MPREIVEVSVVGFPGRPIRFVMTCLVAAGLSSGEVCLCGSSPATCHSTADGANTPAEPCCCNLETGGTCRCHTASCQEQTPDKSSPVQQNTGNNNHPGQVKGLTQSLVALACADGLGGWSGNSRFESASSAAPATLQLQHVRLQI